MAVQTLLSLMGQAQTSKYTIKRFAPRLVDIVLQGSCKERPGFGHAEGGQSDVFFQMQPGALHSTKGVAVKIAKRLWHNVSDVVECERPPEGTCFFNGDRALALSWAEHISKASALKGVARRGRRRAAGRLLPRAQRDCV